MFGCLAHVHTLDQRRVKLDDNSRLCVLFGVSDESKAYRLFDAINKKIIIRKDVIFEENKSWGRSIMEQKITKKLLKEKKMTVIHNLNQITRNRNYNHKLWKQLLEMNLTLKHMRPQLKGGQEEIGENLYRWQTMKKGKVYMMTTILVSC